MNKDIKITTNNNFNYNYDFNYQDVIKDIPYYKEWKSIIPIYKGFSDDLKFKIETIKEDQPPLLLRISDSKNEKEKMIEFKIMEIFNNSIVELEDENDDEKKRLINISNAIDIGLCNGGKNVWILLTWVEGDDFNDTLSSIPIDDQYKLGLKAGKLLKKFHSIKINNYYQFINDNNLLETHSRDNVERRLNGVVKFENDINNKYRFNGDQSIINFIKLNLQKIADENFKLQGNSLVLKHNDYHCGNMVLNKLKGNGDGDGDGSGEYQLGLIDFNRFSIGYGYEEFQKLQSFSKEISIPFSVGQIDGYFEGSGEPTQLFWESFATFTAVSCISMILWGERISNAELESMKNRCQRVMNEFNNFNSIIPNWYINYKNFNKKQQ